jgi:IS30 family transposase
VQALDLLRVQHSPETIAGCLRISHETVYQRVYDHLTGELKERSAAVETRKHIGHWEAETVIGDAHKGGIGDAGGAQVRGAVNQE